MSQPHHPLPTLEPSQLLIGWTSPLSPSTHPALMAQMDQYPHLPLPVLKSTQLVIGWTSPLSPSTHPVLVAQMDHYLLSSAHIHPAVLAHMDPLLGPLKLTIITRKSPAKNLKLMPFLAPLVQPLPPCLERHPRSNGGGFWFQTLGCGTGGRLL
jgi:hypothetical protein